MPTALAATIAYEFLDERIASILPHPARSIPGKIAEFSADYLPDAIDHPGLIAGITIGFAVWLTTLNWSDLAKELTEMSLATYFRNRRDAVIQRMVNEASAKAREETRAEVREEARAEARAEVREETRAETRQEVFQELSCKSKDELLATFGYGDGQFPHNSGETPAGTPAAPDQ